MTMEEFNNSTPEAMVLLQRQLEAWPLAATNFKALENVETREMQLHHTTFTLQFNPARIASTGAKIDSGSIKKRACFLCKANRPPEQMELNIGNGYLLLVNPFPIFPVHFTIPAAAHTPQLITADNCAPFAHMAALALKLPGLALFYNGPRCGASAPDHMHFQAVERHRLPLIQYIENGEPLPFRVFTDTFTDIAEATGWFRTLIGQLPVPAAEPPHEETPLNVLCTACQGENGEPTGIRVVVIPRKAHRPDFYGTGENEILVSPASVDLGGVIILPSPDDFHRKFTPAHLEALIDQTCYPQT